MESIYLLIPLSIVLVAVAVWAFFWAVNQGQFEDLEAPSQLALEEDQPLRVEHEPDTDLENVSDPTETSFNADAKPLPR